MNAKKIINDLLPPLAVRLAKRIFGQCCGSSVCDPAQARRKLPQWETMPQGWDAEAQDAAIKGWNVEEILKAYQEKWPAFVRSIQGPRPFGLPPEAINISDTVDLAYHNSVMIFGYCLALAARSKTRVSLLDWGGGIGHYYLIARALLPEVEIEYHCKDLPLLAQHGQTLFPEAHFYSNDSCLSRRYDFILAGTSLHYSKDWRATLQGLAGAAGQYLLVTGLPIAFHSPSSVFVQRPYLYGYNTEYLGWRLNREEFLSCAQTTGLDLLREFAVGYRVEIHGDPEPCEFRGFLFQRKQAEND